MDGRIHWTGMAAVAVSAITGALETGCKPIDLYSMTLVAPASARGGGTIRDVLLDRPALWIDDQGYLVCALAAGVATFTPVRLVRLPPNLFLIPDAVGLALFTVVGTRIWLVGGVPRLAASLLGVVTGVVGGVCGTCSATRYRWCFRASVTGPQPGPGRSPSLRSGRGAAAGAGVPGGDGVRHRPPARWREVEHRRAALCRQAIRPGSEKGKVAGYRATRRLPRAGRRTLLNSRGSHDPYTPVPVPLTTRSRLAVALALAFTAVVGVASVNPDPAAPLPVTTVESLALPALASAASRSDESVVVWDVLGPGDTLFVALSRLGILDPSAEEYLRRARDARPFVDAAAGTLLRAVRTGEGTMLELAQTSSTGRTYVMTRDGERFRVTRDDSPARLDLALRAGPVGRSIFKSFADAGVPRSVADQVIRIFSRQFDLHAAAGEIERFAVVYERLSHGLSERPGRVLGVELVRAGKPYRAFWFSPQRNGRGAYFGPEGFSLEREFLPAPLEYTEITSWFGVSRQIGRRWQAAHHGIDYAAPIGTPVHATADGTVEFLGVQGGYGNLVVLRHRGTLSTYYAHLHGFAEGLSPGARVRQGELLGYVGRTGWATGPHLHYELRVDDKPVNPEEHVPVAEALADPERIERFREASAPLAAKLDLLGIGPLARFE